MPQDINKPNIYFPVAHGLALGKLVQLNYFLAKDARSPIQVIANRDIASKAEDIISSSRFTESNTNAGNSVIITLSDTQFSGNSFGLSIAIADKIARLKTIDHRFDTIYATGEITLGGKGSVNRINLIAEKLDLIYKHNKSHSIVVLPNDNYAELPANLISKFRKINIELCPVNTLDELDGKLWKSSLSKEVNRKQNSTVYLTRKAFILYACIALLAATLFFIGVTPIHTQQTSTHQPPIPKSQQPIQSSGNLFSLDQVTSPQTVTPTESSEEKTKNNPLQPLEIETKGY